jgi:predicted PurR-regulated permease PerM
MSEPPTAPWLTPSRYGVFLLVSSLVAGAMLVASRAVLLPFVLAMVLAYLLTPLVRVVERRRVPRAAAIILVYVVVLGGLAGFGRAVIPRVGQELGELRRELPSLVREARATFVPWAQDRLRDAGLVGPPSDDPTLPDVPGFDLDRLLAELPARSFVYAQQNAVELVRFGRDLVTGVGRFFLLFGLTLMLAAYMMLTRERIAGFFLGLARPGVRPWLGALGRRIDAGLSGVVRGQLVICLVNGVLSAIGFAIVGLKHWPVLALVATVLSLIPIFGSIISSIPAVALGLTQSLGTAAFVLAWIVGIHQLEANVLNPKIMGDAAKIHPVLVIFALLAGEHFFGVLGALLAVPCMSIAQSVFLHVLASLRPASFADAPGPE